MARYKTIPRKQDVGMRITSLYRTQQLSIGILDVGDAASLCECLDWFMGNMNCTLHAVTLEDTFEANALGERYPEVTFICFSNLASLGEMVNAFADECYATYFMVARSDMQVLGFDGQQLMGIMAGKEHPAMLMPVMLNGDMEVLPTIRAPRLRGRDLDPVSFMPSIEPGTLTANLYPVMGLGLYDRALFQRLRGFDEEISGEFWQTLDFGGRCHLFGFPCYTCSDFCMRFVSKRSIIEDRSECQGINRCYTKLLSVHRIAGKNVAEKWKPYVDKELFKTEVKKKQTILQKTDFFTLVNDWKGGDE